MKHSWESADGVLSGICIIMLRRRMNSGTSVLDLGEILLSLFYFNRVFKLD